MHSPDAKHLSEELERVQCKSNDILVRPFEPIEHVYFLEGGLASMVVFDEARGATAVGMCGYEGLIGTPAILGADDMPHQVVMQVGGPTLRMSAKALRQAMEQSASLRSVLIRYAYILLLEASHGSYVNSRFRLNERLARWLLMAADRLGPQLPLTHKFLGHMLGARRAGVTEALHILEGEKLITSARCHIVVRDRVGLVAHAGSAYGVSEGEYARLIGPVR
jgi:CRP-like cAMP-binding protein